MYLYFSYYYRGSINCSLKFEPGENPGSISLLTSYNEKIATVYNTDELIDVIQKLKEDKYA